MKGKSKSTLVPNAKSKLNQLKYEIASEFNMPSHVINSEDWGDVSCKDCGTIGGEMVKRMIAAAQSTLVSGTTSNVLNSFNSSLGSQSSSGHHNQGSSS